MNTKRTALLSFLALAMMLLPTLTLWAQTMTLPPATTAKPKPGGGLGDGITADKVRHILITDRRFDPSGIKVVSSSGKVALNGTVATEQARKWAQWDAEKAPNVHKVVNRLKIKP